MQKRLAVFLMILSAWCYADNAQFEQTLRRAEQGDVEAQEELGGMYFGGYGGAKQNIKESVKWYTKAAEGGSREATCDMALMYGEGRHVPQSYAKAVFWHRKTLQKPGKGASICTYAFAKLYYDGNGVRRNPVVAYALINYAIALAPPAFEAQLKNRDLVAESLSPSQVVAAQDLSVRLAESKDALATLDAFLDKALDKTR